jgi:flavin-dependent dehydrogenase
LLVDKRPLESFASVNWPPKCCGGLLAPDAQKSLAVLGLGLPRHVLMEPQVFVVRVIDVRRRLERFYQRHYINMDRGAFDRWLVSLVPETVDVRGSCRFLWCEAGGGSFRIELACHGHTRAERARAVIGADGAGSRLRRAVCGARASPKVYAAVQEWCEADETLPYFSVIFDRDVTDYYSWTIPKDGFLVVGSALPAGAGWRARFGLLRERLADFGFRLGRSTRREGALLLRPTWPRQVCAGAGGIGLIGEAAGWISPSSAEGLSYAFRSAMMMADALRDGLDGFLGRYRSRARALWWNVLRKNAKSLFIHRPGVRMMVMRSGIGSMEVAERGAWKG